MRALLANIALGLLWLSVGASSPPSTALANANTIQLIAEVRDALHKLGNPPAGDGAGQPKIYWDSAVQALTELYQLYGCEWAADDLRALYARTMAPELRLGYSTDGRVLLRVEPLDLKNPAYTEYTILLCTLHSETADDLRDSGEDGLAVTLPDDTELTVETVQEGHPLWPHLKKLAPQFTTLTALPSGAGISFKQLYAVPRRRLPLNHCAVSLAWGGLSFELPRWDTEAADG